MNRVIEGPEEMTLTMETSLADSVLRGNMRAIARAITLIENDETLGTEIVNRLYPLTGRAHVIGVTGPPGVGKSTLVDRLAREYRKAGGKVAVIAVDPSSPFTGGAILGDRIRMEQSGKDEGVFIRSLASRGQMGGLSKSTWQVIRLFDAAGYEPIIVETVGAGQGEVDVMKYAHTVLVVLVPGLGDEIQAIKAGILEIADIYVINKSERREAERLKVELEFLRETQSERRNGWLVPIVNTVALEGKGVPELVKEIERHVRFLRDSSEWERRRVTEAESELKEVLASKVLSRLIDCAVSRGDWQAAVEKVVRREIDPYSAADELVRTVFRSDP